MTGRSASRIAHDEEHASVRDGYLDRIIERVGTGDLAMILRRVVVLVEAGESGVSIAARLNPPARALRVMPEDSPFHRPRTLVATTRDTVAKSPASPPPPKPAPPKPRPVKRPAPQRKGERNPGAGGRLVESVIVAGVRVQRIECRSCLVVWERPHRPGRLPATCEACR